MTDVLVEIEIARPRADVAAYASDPDNTPQWYENITAVQWKSPRPLAVGSRIAFAARFLGRRLSYTYEVTDLAPGHRLVMATESGPFPMETTSTWEDSPTGTRMTLRNRGGLSGLARIADPIVSAAVRRATRNDLARLKQILEQ